MNIQKKSKLFKEILLTLALLLALQQPSNSQHRQPHQNINRITGLEVTYDHLCASYANTNIKCLPWFSDTLSTKHTTSNLAIITQSDESNIDTIHINNAHIKNMINSAELKKIEAKQQSKPTKNIIINGISPSIITHNGYIIYYTKDLGYTATPSFDLCIIENAAILRIEEQKSGLPIYRAINIRQVTY